MTSVEASALQDIERRVQSRAKDTSLDMAGEGGKAKLRALIADEVAAWSDAYKRGLRAFDLADPDIVAERAYRNLAGYGPLEPLLVDDDVGRLLSTPPTVRSSNHEMAPSSASGRYGTWGSRALCVRS